MTKPVNLARFREGVFERGANGLSPYEGSTLAAMASAEMLMDALADAGMPRSHDFVECLATIIDVRSALPELIGASIAAWELCSTALVTGDALHAKFADGLREEFVAVTARLREALDRASVRIINIPVRTDQ